jgi:CBS domain-containing protein
LQSRWINVGATHDTPLPLMRRGLGNMTAHPMQTVISGSIMDIRTLNNVREILLPYSGDLPLTPSVSIDDPISRVIEVMVRYNRRILPVLRDKRPVGQVRIQDAFAILGVRMP